MKVVVKIGSSSLTRADGGIDHEAISRLCRDVASLASLGHQPIVVSSGAVAAGVGAVGVSDGHNTAGSGCTMTVP